MNSSRPIITRLWQLRLLGTAVAKEPELAAEKPVRLYQKLSAPGSTGGSVSETSNEHVADGWPASNYDFQSLREMLLRELQRRERKEREDREAINSINREEMLSSIMAKNTNSSTPPAKELELATEKPVGLYHKLLALGSAGGSVSETLNDHMADGRWVSRDELVRIIKQLRRYSRHDHALQVMEWMESRNLKFSFQDYAICVDLISKVKGWAEAENYFNNLPAFAKNKLTYVSLLNFYCKEAMEDKALLLFKEMEGLGLAGSTLPYNNIMSLYLRMDKPEKIPGLVEEMKRKNISLHSFTYNIWMQSYARLDDIEGVEKVYSEMLENDASLCDWTTYSNLASYYVKAGLAEKAESALKKLESIMDLWNREAYHYLITLYTNLSNLKEVHRVWDSLKASLRVTTNVSYIIMLCSLRRLKDLEGLKKVFEEWESKCSRYDGRIVKIVIASYLDQDKLEEAEALFRYASTKASRPFLSGMELFMVYFLKKRQMDRCVEFLEAAASISKNEGWMPQMSTINTFLMYFEGSGDVETANKLFNFLKDVGSLKGTAYNMLLRAYVAAGKTDPDLRKMLEEDEIGIDDELEMLLKNVCPAIM